MWTVAERPWVSYMCAGSAAAFQVLADANLWPEAVHLAAACLAGNCEQPAQLLVCLRSTITTFRMTLLSI